MSDHKPSDPKKRTPYYKPNGDPYTFVTQDSPENRKWTWKEDGYTVVRTHARTGPGCHSNCGVLLYIKDGRVEKLVTMGSPSAAGMHSTVWPLVEPDVVEYLQDRLMEQTERIIERAKAKGGNA